MTNIMQKIIKVLIIVLIMQIIFAVGNVSQAAISWENIMSSGDNFLNTGKEEASDGKITIPGEGNTSTSIGLPGESSLKTTINSIYNILFPLGVAVTVIIGGILGIKFMMASAEDKAKIKESLVPYVVGCVVIYGAFGIWKLAILVFSSI